MGVDGRSSLYRELSPVQLDRQVQRLVMRPFVLASSKDPSNSLNRIAVRCWVPSVQRDPACWELDVEWPRARVRSGAPRRRPLTQLVSHSCASADASNLMGDVAPGSLFFAWPEARERFAGIAFSEGCRPLPLFLLLSLLHVVAAAHEVNIVTDEASSTSPGFGLNAVRTACTSTTER